jgi:protein translocase SecG subunit
MSLLINILLGIYVFVAVLMMLVILMQRPKSEGLGAAFGGGVTENIFGAQTTNVLTKVTGWLAAIFFLLTFFLSILYARKAHRSSDLSRELLQGSVPVPAATATPGTTSPAPGTPSPGPSSAVGPPGTITNMTPATTGPAPSVRPSDAAVGAVPPVTNTSPATTGPAPSTAASTAPATSPASSPKP